jgi:hypothetical protein
MCLATRDAFSVIEREGKRREEERRFTAFKRRKAHTSS